MIRTINPYNETVIAEYDEYSEIMIDEFCRNSYLTFLKWKEVSIPEKSVLLKRVANILLRDITKFASLITEEMGKPIKQSKAEIEKSALVCHYYAENAKDFLSDVNYKTEYSKSYVRYEPLGPVLAIMPWNFPFWQVFRFAAPNLIAGNTAILKHASNTTGCSIAIQNIFSEAEFPEFAFKSLVVSSKNMNKVISNKNIKAITLTGSTPAGQEVASSAGKLIKKTVLELGGSDPYIVLDDADIDLAVNSCASGRMLNSGQSCIAAKRFIVDKLVINQFTDKLLSRINTEITGNPFNEDTTVGPLAKRDLRDELEKQVSLSIAKGATLLTGGKIPNTKGYFYEPTILSNVKPLMPAFDEELFGPVSVIVEADNTDHAVELANMTDFGLGAAVFSKDTEKAVSIANRIEAGSVFINDFVKSDPRLPFGGIKHSGYGRELSDLGIKEFLNPKTICVK